MSVLKSVLGVTGVVGLAAAAFVKRDLFKKKDEQPHPLVAEFQADIKEQLALQAERQKAAEERKEAVAEADDSAGVRDEVVEIVADKETPSTVKAVEAHIRASTETYTGEERDEIAKRLESVIDAEQEPRAAKAWASFMKRICENKGIVDAESDEALIAMQPRLRRGYTPVRVGDDKAVGIVHVTREGLNALFPIDGVSFRVVSNNQRFAGMDVVNLAAAELFMGGRY